MAKRVHEHNHNRWRSFLILLTVACTFVVTYFGVSALLRTSASSLEEHRVPAEREDESACCRGMEHLEFWGDAVNWGSNFLVDSARECCEACKKKFQCNSWVYCGNQELCSGNYRQCWLKRQKDPLDPEIHGSSSLNPWTSGLVTAKDAGTIGLALNGGAANGGVIHMKLLPECSPQSVLRILELAKLTHCSGCRIYRAEGRGNAWDSNGIPISKMGTGPPYALLQGTLEAQHVSFKRIAREFSPPVKRGMVGWVDGGPDFFISLADHPEWPRSNKHTVFATVVEEDMPILEALTKLPTTKTVWERVPVQVLDEPVNVKVQRVNKQ